LWIRPGAYPREGLGWKGLLRKFINYDCKKFYNIAPGLHSSRIIYLESVEISTTTKRWLSQAYSPRP
jgi:hypothetical protein